VSRYLQTFSRHKIALVLPIIIALTLSGYYAKSAPHKYTSTTAVWFDTSVPNASSLVSPLPYTTPATQGQAVLQEFLGTEQFLVSVGHLGPLAGLLAKSGASPAVVDGQVATILSKAFVTTIAGPNIVKITMTGTDPSFMTATLNAVPTAYVDAVTSDLKSRDVASVSTYQAQLNAAKLTLDSANTAVQSFLLSHPGQAATTNPTYNQLTQAAVQAQTTYSGVETSLQQATLSLQNVQAPSSFRVVDPAQAAIKLSGKKHMIFTIVAGMAAGFIISALALSALTASDKTARRQEDIDGVLGMEVVAIISQLPPQRRLPGTRKLKSS
jgi:uncharacterized protein involved in exopolysaccharide biosynthesis